MICCLIGCAQARAAAKSDVTAPPAGRELSSGAAARPAGDARSVSKVSDEGEGGARVVKPASVIAPRLPALEGPKEPPPPPSIQMTTAPDTLNADSPALLPVVSAATLAELGEPPAAPAAQNTPAPACLRTIKADVVAFDLVYFYNRFDAFNPVGMMYALRRDVVPASGSHLSPGNVRLRPDKRPRPIVLRMNEGDCLEVKFTNLLSDPRRDNNSTFTRAASMHVNGLDYVNGPAADDGAHVGKNPTSLAEPGEQRTYRWYGAKQGQYLMFSMGAPAGGEGDNGQGGLGLFGTVNVEPKGAKWYRSQVTAAELAAATVRTNPNKTPVIDYEKKRADGTPILNMLNANNEIVHTDLNAIITGFVEDCVNAPPSGTCGQPFREFSVLFHDEIKAVQAFSEDRDGDGHIDPDSSPLDQELFHGVRDAFAINYGASGLGSILLANRKRVGPSKDCNECKFEDFFLTSWVNGDPAMVVRRDSSKRAVEALYPDDPSNVHHSYLGDPVRFRNVHIGKETHVFHLHAHQWLQSPRDENSTYLDSQTISPGAAFTYEINYGGSGNRNFTPGDAIFHCHLYPHFAQGMWELWRVHDVFEQGTNDRRLPDAEIAGGTPNPAVVPLPNQPMPPMPTDDFRGYPFYVAAQAGHRPPQPPLDIERDGGLPRHRVLAAEVVDGRPAIEPELLDDPVAARVLSQNNDPNLLAFARKLVKAKLELLPLAGTFQEQTAMQFHEGLRSDVGVDTSSIPTIRFPCETCRSTTAPTAVAPPPASSDPVCPNCPPPPKPGEVVDTVGDAVTNAPGTIDTVGDTVTGAPGLVSAEPAGIPVVTKYEWPARGYPSFTATGEPGLFLVNGQPRTPGAPFAEPCLPASPRRNYRAAYVQFDMPVNRAGWHDRQARITTLEDDAHPTLSGARTAEPLFFRANSRDCINFSATNLVPHVLNLDDFQIFTPTDTIGQHIHLVKFDVMASDGAGNGWNYEDGTFSPGEVQERIEANNKFREAQGQSPNLEPKVNAKFGAGPDLDGNGVGDFVGAQTTVQRWWADPLVNNARQDRTIRTVFTHDHFGPSSHQHHGLYGALVIEPTASTWTTINGQPMGTRPDGGPTSYAANVITPDQARSYREFNLAFADFAIVYRPDLTPVNPPGRRQADLPINIEPTEMPMPEAISAADPGTQLINYRNEPIPLRVGQDNGQGQFVQKPGAAGDMAFVFSSEQHGDPFTPILPAIEGDRVQVRLIQGAQEEQHVFNLHAEKWLFEPSAPNSGYRNAQQIGISEHFEFVLDRLPTPPPALGGVLSRDFLYSSAATDNLWDGQWGLMRVGRKTSLSSDINDAINDLGRIDWGPLGEPVPLPNNPVTDGTAVQLPDPQEVCPAHAPQREFLVSAFLARDLVPEQALVYNQRFGIKDPHAIVFIENEDEAALRTGARKLEPLILRAAAGDCIRVKLFNRLPAEVPEEPSWNTLPMIVNRFNFNQVRSSNRVGLHAQLVSFDPLVHDGAKVGRNFDSTVGPEGVIDYVWYAGDRKFDEQTGEPIPTPIEFGATGLRDMGDAIKHASHGATGALIIEPQGSTWTPDPHSKASADVRDATGSLLFREFVVIYQDDLSLRQNGAAMPNIGEEDDSEDTGQKGFNYRTEPLWERLNVSVKGVPDEINDKDMRNVLSSLQPNPGCNGPCGDPETPVFSASAGTPVRFRVVQTAGHPRQHGYTLFGHHWQFEPWQANSTRQGFNPFTFEIGSESGIGPTRHVNILTTAGGLFNRPGDYLYRTQESFQFTGGLWGIFRVTASNGTKVPGPCAPCEGDLLKCTCPPIGPIN